MMQRYRLERPGGCVPHTHSDGCVAESNGNQYRTGIRHIGSATLWRDDGDVGASWCGHIGRGHPADRSLRCTRSSYVFEPWKGDKHRYVREVGAVQRYEYGQLLSLHAAIFSSGCTQHVSSHQCIAGITVPTSVVFWYFVLGSMRTSCHTPRHCCLHFASHVYSCVIFMQGHTNHT